MITPNKVEFDRLLKAMIESTSTPPQLLPDLQSSDKYLNTRALALALKGPTVIRKGATDLITSGRDIFEVDQEGSMRRCGGQGDILAGNECFPVYF